MQSTQSLHLKIEAVRELYGMHEFAGFKQTIGYISGFPKKQHVSGENKNDYSVFSNLHLLFLKDVPDRLIRLVSILIIFCHVKGNQSVVSLLIKNTLTIDEGLMAELVYMYSITAVNLSALFQSHLISSQCIPFNHLHHLCMSGKNTLMNSIEWLLFYILSRFEELRICIQFK